MEKGDCIKEKWSSRTIGFLILPLALIIGFFGTILLPLLGLFFAVPLLLLSLVFILAPESKVCQLLMRHNS